MFTTQRKLLSQNFLKDRGLVDRLIRDSGISKQDVVLEIGPGKGIITEGLLVASKKVVAIEIDGTLFATLQNRFRKYQHLELIKGDFLRFGLPIENYKVFSNIPFAITGEIVKKLLLADNPPSSCNLIVQKEVVEKFLVNSEKNFMLGILFYPWFKFKVGYQFERDDFRPNPGVDLSFLRIAKRRVPLIPLRDIEMYRDFVVYQFTKNRLAGRWRPERWLISYLKNTPCRGAFAKWQTEQKNLVKIHRTRNDRNWKKFGTVKVADFVN